MKSHDHDVDATTTPECSSQPPIISENTCIITPPVIDHSLIPLCKQLLPSVNYLQVPVADMTSTNTIVTTNTTNSNSSSTTSIMNNSSSSSSSNSNSNKRPPSLDAFVDHTFVIMSPKKQRFLSACEDSRPSTIGACGPVNPTYNRTACRTMAAIVDDSPRAYVECDADADADATIKHSKDPLLSRVEAPSIDHKHRWEVSYVGGWKRGRKKLGASSNSPNDSYMVDGGEVEMNTTRNMYNGRPQQRNNNNNNLSTHHHDNHDHHDGSGIQSSLNNNTSSSSLDASNSVIHMSSIVETASIFTALVRKQLRCLAFCKVRKLVELVLSYSQRNLELLGTLPCSILFYTVLCYTILYYASI